MAAAFAFRPVARPSMVAVARTSRTIFRLTLRLALGNSEAPRPRALDASPLRQPASTDCHAWLCAETWPWRCPTTCVTCRRRAKRDGEPNSDFAVGRQVDAEVRCHTVANLSSSRSRTATKKTRIAVEYWRQRPRKPLPKRLSAIPTIANAGRFPFAAVRINNERALVTFGLTPFPSRYICPSMK